jgi:hypothetical protein
MNVVKRIIISLAGGLALGLLANLIVLGSHTSTISFVAPGSDQNCLYANYVAQHPECRLTPRRVTSYNRGFPAANSVTKIEGEPRIAAFISYPTDTTHFVGLQTPFIIPINPWVFNAVLYAFLIWLIWSVIATFIERNF